MSRAPYALTYPQLALQAIRRGYDARSLERLRAAHDLALDLFDGYYRAQDTPFISHVLRTASIAMEHEMPEEAVLGCLLHAAYTFGRFRDGRGGLITKVCEEELRRVAGKEVESLIAAYTRFSFHDAAVLEKEFDEKTPFSPFKTNLILMVLANELEDHLDLQMAFRRHPERESHLEKTRPWLIGFARKLGRDALAEELLEGFRQTGEVSIPDVLKTDKPGAYELDRRYRMRKGKFRLFLSHLKRMGR